VVAWEGLTNRNKAPWKPVCFFFSWFCGLNSGPTPYPLHQPIFMMSFSWGRVSGTVCPGWHWTSILLITAFWVTRITGVSHQYPA
jgi:hypothetical protein